MFLTPHASNGREKSYEVHPTIDQHTFAPGGGVSNSRDCGSELKETRACLCELSDQLRDFVEHNSSSPGVRIISQKQKGE